jgi:transcription elongation factor SPT4
MNIYFKSRVHCQMETLPSDKRKLRACMLCSLIKTHGQFRKDGCDNCDEILKLRGSGDRVQD